jgi:hypothetical protein
MTEEHEDAEVLKTSLEVSMRGTISDNAWEEAKEFMVTLMVVIEDSFQNT